MKKQSETYAKINIADLSLIDFAQIGETDENTIRKSIDGTQFIIKYDTEPTFIADGTVTPLEVMTHTQALTLMASPEWAAPIDEGFVSKSAQIKL